MQHDAISLQKWRNDQDSMPWISSVYGKKFNALAPKLFENSKMEMACAEVPHLSQLEFNTIQEKHDGFCSNLTYTTEDFSNTFHRDLDFNLYTYGIRAPISIGSSNLSSKQDGFQSRGGEFVLASYKVFVDFNACDGVVEIIWRGKTDFHSTLASTTMIRYTRLGTSVQVSDDLVQRLKMLVHMFGKNSVNIGSRVRGVQQIVDSKFKRLK